MAEQEPNGRAAAAQEEEGKRGIPALPERDQVVLVCQTLPRLRRVEFKAPMKYEMRGKGAAGLERLERKAMNRRVNCLE